MYVTGMTNLRTISADCLGACFAGAIRHYSEEWSKEPTLSTSRYFTAYGAAFSIDGSKVYVGEAYKNRVLSVDVFTGILFRRPGI